MWVWACVINKHEFGNNSKMKSNVKTDCRIRIYVKNYMKNIYNTLPHHQFEKDMDLTAFWSWTEWWPRRCQMRVKKSSFSNWVTEPWRLHKSIMLRAWVKTTPFLDLQHVWNARSRNRVKSLQNTGQQRELGSSKKTRKDCNSANFGPISEL